MCRLLERKPDSGHIGCRGTEIGSAASWLYLVKGLEAKGKMRSFLIAFSALTLLATGAAQAKVAITID